MRHPDKRPDPTDGQPLRRRIVATGLSALLTFSLVPAPALAEGTSELADLATAAQTDVATASLGEDSYAMIQDDASTDKPAYNLSGEQKVGTTLYAKVYDSSWDDDEEEQVTSLATDDGTFAYQWFAADAASANTSDYSPIEGETKSTLTLTKELSGKYIALRVTVGDSTFWAPSNSSGINTSFLPQVETVSDAGDDSGEDTPRSVTIYSASLYLDAEGTKSTGSYTENDTVWAIAREKPDGTLQVIDPSLLTYQWYESDSSTKGGTDPIPGATSQSLSLEGLAGKYVSCRITPKAGGTTYKTRATNKVISADAIQIGNVTLDHSGTIAPGTTLQATATSTAGDDVTSSDKVTWSWYKTSSSYASTSTGTKIEGATGSSLTVDDTYNGSYVFAVANGGGSDVLSATVGPVKVEGTVSLHHVEATGQAVIGGTVTAKAYTSSYATVRADDVVSYQWQYADSNTTTDSSFHDIPDATGASYVIPESFQNADGTTVSLLGTYLRVKATSDGSVVSTSKPSYYGTTSVDPLGPVSVKGGYDLTGIDLSSDKTNAQVGATLSAVAQYLKKGSYSSYDADVPSDAEVTYTWYQATDADGTNATAIKTETITGPTASTLALTQDQLGTYVWVEAVAHMKSATSNKATVREAGTYDLSRVNLSPSNETVLTGSEVSASVYANQLGKSTATAVTGRDGVSVQWYVADSADAADDQWTALDGATGATLTVPAEAAGKYLRAVATSGSTSVSNTFSSPVVDKTSLEGAVALLNQGYGWRPSLTYGTDTNINDVLKSALEAKGFDTTGLTIKVKDVTFGNTNASAQVGIANEDSEHNGEITYFYIDPTATSSWSITSLHTVNSITFELTRDGQTVEYTPGRTFQIPWDEAKLGELLQQRADEMAIGYTDGDSAESVTGNLTLPYKAGTSDAATWTSVKWSVPEDTTAVTVSGYGWSDYTGKVTRGSSDAAVTLTATVTGSSSYDMPTTVSATCTFDVTVKADPEKVTEATTELQQKLDANFTWANVKDFATGGTVDQSAVTGDLQLPRTSVLGIDGKYYTVAYSSTSDLVTINGYHAEVVRPLGTDATADLTLTLTDKANPEITATKTIEGITIKAVDESDIDAEVTLLDETEAGYKEALLDGQTEPAGENLSTFQKAYLDNGTLTYARSTTETSGHEGIVPTELPGYDSMGSYDQARTFKSSNTDVVLNETLQLAWNADRSTSLSQYHEQPQYNTAVTVSSRLRSERFGAYYDHYKDDASVSQELKDKLSRLAGEDVSARIDIAGVTGEKSPYVDVTVQVVGQDADGLAQTWAAATTYEYGATDGTTANVALTSLLDATKGLTYEATGTGSDWYLSTITKDGRTLGWDATTGKFWQFFVNGTASDVGAGSYVLQDGDTITLAYSAWGSPIPSVDYVNATVSLVVVNDDGTTENWLTGDASHVKAKAGSTAADVTKAALDAAGIGYDDSLLTFTRNGQSLGWDSTTQKYWNLYVNGTFSDKLASNITAAEGDTYSWIYQAYQQKTTVNDVEVHPEKVRPTDVTAEWPAYRNDGEGNTTTASVPTSKTGTSWIQQVYQRQGSSDMNGFSEPILVGGKVFVAVGDQLQMRDASTGEVEASTKLVTSIDSTCRLSYADGVIVVPLHAGILQAVTPDDLTTVWVTPDAEGTAASSTNAQQITDSTQQSLSTLTVSDGYVYAGTSDADKTSGYLRCVRLSDGQVMWTYAPGDSSYYWCGAAATDQGILVAQSSGKLDLMSTAGKDGQGEVLASLKLPSTVSSSVVVEGDDAYVMGYDGTLYKVSLAGGTLTLADSQKLGSYSISTPTVADGKVYVGGSTGTRSTGALFVLDADSLEVLDMVVSFSDGSPIKGTVASSPLVATHDGDTYVYFTANDGIGGAYVYKVGDLTASYLYVPVEGQQQYTLASLVPASDGALYLVNDSGNLFKLGGSTPGTDPTPSDPISTKVAIYRLYNPHSGEHFYTRSADERANLVSLGWRDEGIGWYAPTSGDHVYRLYNPNAGEHHYTMSAAERDHLVAVGWKYEGICWDSDPNKAVPIYREYNPNAYSCNHNFTASKAEHDHLVSIGWRDEGIAWYGVSDK